MTPGGSRKRRGIQSLRKKRCLEIGVFSYCKKGEDYVHNKTRTSMGSDCKGSLWKRNQCRLPHAKQSAALEYIRISGRSKTENAGASGKSERCASMEVMKDAGSKKSGNRDYI